jgi:hypothetical protein
MRACLCVVLLLIGVVSALPGLGDVLGGLNRAPPSTLFHASLPLLCRRERKRGRHVYRHVSDRCVDVGDTPSPFCLRSARKVVAPETAGGGVNAGWGATWGLLGRQPNYYYTGPWWRERCYDWSDSPQRWQCWERQRYWARERDGPRGYNYYPVREQRPVHLTDGFNHH